MEHFDDIFKKKLEQYDSGKPDHLWEGIQQELNRQTVAPFSKWLWVCVSAGVLVVASVTAYFVYEPPQKIADTFVQELIQPAVDPETAMSDAIPGSASTTDAKDITASMNDLSESSGLSAAQNQGKRYNKAHANKNRVPTSDIVASETTNRVTPPRFNWDWNPDIDAIVKAMDTEEKSKSVDMTAKKVVIPSPASVDLSANVTTDNKLESTFTHALVNELNLLPLAKEHTPSSADLGLKMCYSFGSSCSRIYFEPYAAAEYTSVSFKPLNGESQAYMNARVNTEKSLISPAFGGRVSLVSCGGLAIRTGLGYQMNTFRFDYTDANATQNNTINILVDTIFPSMGDTIFIWDTLSIVQHGTFIKQSFNHFRSIDIPLIAGYEIETYKWIFSVNGGAIFNIVSWQKGDILSPELDPISITTGNANNLKAFKTSTGISLTANLGFYYKLPNHSQVLIEPYFRYPLKSVTFDDYPLEEKHLTGGIRVGLRLPIGR